MDKAYSPGEIEARIYERWESSGSFAPQGDGPAYCIMLPPPNVTGTLHMGHAFQHTLMDTLTRWHRMRGDAALWQPGTDHAGIATQMVVERQLGAEGKHRLDLGREAFIERVWKWKGESGSTITRQMRRLGTSVDWSRDKFTMDPDLSRAVTEVFVRLHDKGLIYRGKRLVNWDPVLLTAVSDLEVLSEEEQGSLWHIKYPIVGGDGHVVVATTRPETLLGDTAVAVNPDDERYQALIGKHLQLPLAGRTIPVITDTYVDATFGSGAVKITPAHDFNDYEMGQRHDLAQINIFTPDAKLNENAPERFRGLDRFVARKQIVAELEAAGLVEKIEPHKLNVPRGDRTGAVIEPYLTDQWYVKIAPLAEPALAAVTEGRTRFVPENWAKTYFEWMRNIKDWCVSRQLWWGHRIPAWYDDSGKIYVGRDEAEVRRKHSLGDARLRQDEDVLDTWFSSALWPFSTLGWPDQTQALNRFYPTSVLVTGFDIIFFWVARMMMMGLEFMRDVPFKDIYITGLILDEHGEKMSKTKGNVIDPLDVVDGISLDALVEKRTTALMQPHRAPAIEKATRKQFPDGIAAYGTDALRFTFASLAGPSREIRFDLGRVGGNRNFCNKLWNGARFVLMTVEAGVQGEVESTTAMSGGDLVGEAQLSVADRWIISRFAATLAQVDSALAEYRFDFAATALYEFTWYEFCDWYLELTKPVLQGETTTEAQKRGTRRTLVTVLEALLRALHPVMPFITEEIWQRVHPLAAPLLAAQKTRANQGSVDSIMLTAYPGASDYARDTDAESQVTLLKEYILKVRQIRGEMNIAPSRKIPLLVRDADEPAQVLIRTNAHFLNRLAGLESLKVLDPGDAEPVSASAMVVGTTLLVPLAGLIDAAAEIDRLTKVIGKNESDIGKLRAKLGNESFVKNAKPELVEADRARLAELVAQNASLAVQLERVRRLGGKLKRRHEYPVAVRDIVKAVNPPNSAQNPALTAALAALDSVILGKPEAVRLALACLLARGHLLIEDVPGVGKTTLAHALAQVLGLAWQRVQFTSDLLPADIIGVSVFDAASGGFSFRKGPMFTQLLLADEVNRASPKTQSALLEAMEERQVSVDVTTYRLPDPFFVVATQNPFEQLGTFRLPESQLDRFLMRISLGYPDAANERALLAGGDRRDLLAGMTPALNPDGVRELQAAAQRVHVAPSLLEYVQALIASTRQRTDVLLGLSPRAGQGLVRAARAWAMLAGRDMVIPEDVQAVFAPVATHRLERAGVATAIDHAAFIAELKRGVPVPV